jgi:hypothetical protein
VSPRATALAYTLGGLPLAIGAGLLVIGEPSGLGPFLIGLGIVAAVYFEPRYGRPRQSDTGLRRWEATGERFVDDESGDLIEVWYDPANGERQYRPVPRD